VAVAKNPAVDRRSVRVAIKRRGIVAIYLLSIITLGIYAIYWAVKTKEELKGLGAEIPSAWLIIVPIANLYWLYRYTLGWAERVKKDGNGLLYFIIFLLVFPVFPAIVQSELNKLATTT
jgi:hypothetical protein